MHRFISVLHLNDCGNAEAEAKSPFCGICIHTLVQEIQEIFDKIGDSQEEQDAMFHEADKGCIVSYMKQLEKEKLMKVHLIKTMANLRAEVQHLEDELSENGITEFSETSGPINVQIDDLCHGLESLQAEKTRRMRVHQTSIEHVDRLRRMKESASKKQTELEEILVGTHMEIDVAAREMYLVCIDGDESEVRKLLAELDVNIIKAKEDVVSRKEILKSVKKWMLYGEDESWLDDFNRDKNRYKSRKGSHNNLKRAEKARLVVKKIPALLDELIAKIRIWEQDRDRIFTYDGVPLRTRLENDAKRRQESVEEKKRSRI